MPRVEAKDEAHHEQVEQRKDALAEIDVPPLTGDVVQQCVQVQVTGWVDDRPSVALDRLVVERPAKEALHLLHVSGPVDFGVWENWEDYGNGIRD